METVETKTGPKKGTKTTESILGKAAVTLNGSLKSFEKFLGEVNAMPKTIEDYTLQITNLEAKIETLNTEYKEKKRQFDVQLELEKKADTHTIVAEYLESQSLTSIEISELTRLKDELTKFKTNFEEQLSKEVGKAVGYAKANLENEKKLMEAMFKAQEAENKSTITSLTAQLAAAKADTDQWKAQLNSERDASIKRAQASSVGAINVTAPGK
jgi:hypothetical protein